MMVQVWHVIRGCASGIGIRTSSILGCRCRSVRLRGRWIGCRRCGVRVWGSGVIFGARNGLGSEGVLGLRLCGGIFSGFWQLFFRLADGFISLGLLGSHGSFIMSQFSFISIIFTINGGGLTTRTICTMLWPFLTISSCLTRL